MKKEALQKLFKSHPSVDEFHITSNGSAFKIKDHALDHARSLKDEEVHTVHRRDVFAPELPPEIKPETKPKAPKKPEIKPQKAEKAAKEGKAAKEEKTDQRPEPEAILGDKQN